MRILLTSILLLPIFALADPVTVEKPVTCAKPKAVIETISGGDINEVPFWVGTDDKSKYVLMVNKKTGTWTMVQYNSDIACIIGFGDNQQQIFLGPKT
jgi:hypothetical protein